MGFEGFQFCKSDSILGGGRNKKCLEIKLVTGCGGGQRGEDVFIEKISSAMKRINI